MLKVQTNPDVCERSKGPNWSRTSTLSCTGSCGCAAQGVGRNNLEHY